MPSLKKRRDGGACSAFGCTMRRGTNLLSEVKMYKFPTNLERRKLWEKAVNRVDFTVTKHSQLCNLHFCTGKPSDDPSHPDYVPSIFCFKKANPAAIDRYERHVKRLKTDASNSADSNNTTQIEVESSNEKTETKDCAVMTDLTMVQLEQIEKANKGYIAINNMLQNAAKQTVLTKTEGNLKAFKFYTKLPSVQFFYGLLAFILDGWRPQTSTALEPAEQFLLVLLKLRLGLWNEDLAYRFEIGAGTVSQIFREWLARMAFVLKKFIQQPSKRTIKKSIPRCFRDVNYKHVTSIIDCSELFIDRPFNLDARAQTYSNYKHHNTVKFLIACTPSGGISFISKTFGGRHTDKEITKLSGFLETVKEDDVILADRGFRIDELVAQRNASIIVPPYTRGKKQLKASEIMRARKMSRVRIHVERCIGRIKSYGIFKYQWPISFLNDKWLTPGGKYCTGDYILIVVAALCNISRPSLVNTHKNQITQIDSDN